MNCAWKELLGILPPGLRQSIDGMGQNCLQEIRMRKGCPIRLVEQTGSRMLPQVTTMEHMDYVINTASRYSPWSAVSTAQGYLTACGGHRIGICGDAVLKNGCMTGFRTIRSLNIRVARDFPGLAAPLDGYGGNILILGPPGCGKTTLLRDLIRLRSAQKTVCVVDERSELFPEGIPIGVHTDIMTGCPKPVGIDILLRTMTPDVIAVDEITAAEDCDALMQAAWCGVTIFATAHARDMHDLKTRSVYRPLVEKGLFSVCVMLHRDKTFHVERASVC